MRHILWICFIYAAPATFPYLAHPAIKTTKILPLKLIRNFCKGFFPVGAGGPALTIVFANSDAPVHFFKPQTKCPNPKNTHRKTV
jgi:hypothetical protein